LACTEGDLCVAGACAGQPVVCNDGLTCTADSCDTATGECLYTPQHALCNDQNPCTDDLCVPGVGCVYTPDNTNVCADELFCNGVELCIKGTCKGGQLPCGDSIDCTADSCNEAKDVCVHVPDDSLCQDALVCNGIEYCDRTKGCKPRPPVVCNDGVACTIDVCVEPGGTCTYTPGDTSCQDDLFCNGEEVCHPTHGCLPGTPVDCDDGALCSTDECNESTDVCDNHCDVPDLTCTDQVFECDNVGEFLPPVIDDDCSENPVATCTEIITPGKLPQERKITRSCSFTNDCSSTGTCQQVINVQDTTPPEIICPPDRSFECDGIGDSGQPIVSDNCDPDPQVTVEVETIEGDCTPNVAGIGVPPKLIKINTFTATDGGATMTATGDATGNVSICEQRIEIVDTHGPLFVDCPASVSGCVDQPLVFVPPSCTDTCGSCLVTCTRSDGLPLAAPVTPGLTISCTSRDECNNASAPCTVSVDTINCDEIPALSLWGLAILALLLMIAAKLRFSRNTLLNT